MELDTLFLRVLDLFLSRGHFGLAAAVDEIDFLRAEPEGHAACVHRDISAAKDCDLLAVPERSVGIAFEVGLHEVRARQILVRRKDAVEVLAFDPHELRKPRARADENGVEAILLDEVLQLARAADHEVVLDLDAELLDRLDLVPDDRLREAELGDAVDENAAAAVERLEHRNVVTSLGAVRRARYRRGA